MARPYEQFGQNAPLKTSHKTKAHSIFQSVNMVLTRGNRFVPAWDTTDHFKFICGECHAVADILAVQFFKEYDEIGAALYFRLGCPECGNTGQRKIYLETVNAPYQKACIEGKMLYYPEIGNKPIAEALLTLKKRKEKE